MELVDPVFVLPGSRLPTQNLLFVWERLAALVQLLQPQTALLGPECRRHVQGLTLEEDTRIFNVLLDLQLIGFSGRLCVSLHEVAGSVLPPCLLVHSWWREGALSREDWRLIQLGPSLR